MALLTLGLMWLGLQRAFPAEGCRQNRDANPALEVTEAEDQPVLLFQTCSLQEKPLSQALSWQSDRRRDPITAR